MTEICIVFVCNKQYFNKFINTCNELIQVGKYNGNICLVIGDDLKSEDLSNTNNFIKTNNIIVKYFPDISFPEYFCKINNFVRTDGRNKTKKFQWHKLHLFNIYFKQWNYIFYIDCGMTIFSDIQPIIDTKKPNKLLAHSDSYPDYQRKLYTQFDKYLTNYYNKLNSSYNLNIDYFQSTILLYDTTIIENQTFQNLYNLSIKYPISNTNEQGIMALYFTNIKSLWEQIPVKNHKTFFYDYLSRNNNYKYIMLKMLL
tara:strand:- start:487 stop:1254 length:768 start_codon:yes stop_codon:yes gene_type:complete